MSNVAEGVPEAPYEQSAIKKLLLFPLGILYKLWTYSIRISYDSQEQSDIGSSPQDPIVMVLWHNRLFLAGEWHRRFRKSMICYGLISASKDGALLETFYGWAGIRAVRGSRNRRGTQAVRDLVRIIKDGHDAGVTPDGSRGPSYQAKPGALLLTKLTKAPILLLSFEFGWSIKLNSWDKFVIPLPFSKVNSVTRVLGHDEIFEGRTIKGATRFVEEKLVELTID
jgi:lysophospholipid acyltransferase (LPLAT)-like uncharacterized protein